MKVDSTTVNFTPISWGSSDTGFYLITTDHHSIQKVVSVV